MRAEHRNHGIGRVMALVCVGMLIVASGPNAFGGLDAETPVTASDLGATDNFGWSVAVSGDIAVIGARHWDAGAADTDEGAAYVFERVNGAWTEQQRLAASDQGAADHFGESVAVSGETIVVGAPGWDAGAAVTNDGAAYVFTRVGGVWTQQQRLPAAGLSSADNFGRHIGVSGDTVVVGVSDWDVTGNNNEGSVYVFTRAGGVWTQQTLLFASDFGVGDLFGCSVAVSGDTLVAGARNWDGAPNAGEGAAYVFTRAGVVWTEQQRLTASDLGAGDEFGYSVGVSGDTAVVGARFWDPAGGLNEGAAYVFTRAGVVWTEEQRLTASDLGDGDRFGYSVVVLGETALVGAPWWDAAGGLNDGAVYEFTRAGVVWTEQQRLTASDLGAGDQFGWSLGLSEKTGLVGAPLWDAGSPDEGAGYFFDPAPPPPPPDRDGDGIPNAADNCPDHANKGQKDFDGDGWGNKCDWDTDGDRVFNLLDAFPWNPMEWDDTDGDRVGDNGDNCPMDPNRKQNDFDADLMGNVCDDDDDNDGIPDADDPEQFTPIAV